MERRREKETLKPGPCAMSDLGRLTSCGSLTSCGHRLIHHRRERPGCHALEPKPRERCVLIIAKSKCSGSNRQILGLWRTGDATCQGSVLPRVPIHANLGLVRPVIRWMSDKHCALKLNNRGRGYAKAPIAPIWRCVWRGLGSRAGIACAIPGHGVADHRTGGCRDDRRRARVHAAVLRGGRGAPGVAGHRGRKSADCRPQQ